MSLVEMLCQGMRNCNTNTQYVKAAKHFITKIKTILKTKECGLHHLDNKVLKQGYWLSSTLFKISLLATLYRGSTACKSMGIQLEDETICSLSLALDQGVLTEDASYMGRKLIEALNE